MTKKIGKRKLIISPSILSADFSRLEEEMKRLSDAHCDTIHVDVMDGVFVPNITFGQAVMKWVNKSATLPMDVHLMIADPGRFIEQFALDRVTSIAVHAEACGHLDRVLRQIQETGKAPAVALNPATPLTDIEWVLDLVKMVVVMTVNPGFGGQSFIASMLPKIEALRNMVDRRGLNVIIGVDGGVTDTNAKSITDAGGNYLVMGNYLFTAREGIRDAAEKVRRICGA